jgi:hypothetical protein
MRLDRERLEPTDARHLAQLRRTRRLRRLRVSVLSFHGQFSVDFTTNITESDFRYRQPSHPYQQHPITPT